jgi:hypothetical protein
MCIPERTMGEITSLASIKMCEDTGDWITFKVMLMRSLPWQLRLDFSTRDSKTKKQSLNEFEHKVINKYYKLTGIKLEIKSKEQDTDE